jgi:hypothetical protein
MNTAREAQRQQALLSTLLRDTGAQALAAWMQEGTPFARGLQAYQAHAGELAERTLAAAFPTLQQLLGDTSFAALARAFWRHSPPRRGDVARWGDGLPAFAAAASDLAGEPYLADVARLEWAVHEAHTAADTTPTSLGLQHLSEGDPARLRLVPCAGTALVVSPYPVVSVWQAHQPETQPQETSADGPADAFAAVREAFAQQRAEAALVWRRAWRVEVAAIPAAEVDFTRQVMQGVAVGPALEAAMSQGRFDFETWLLAQLKRGWLEGVEAVA